MTNRDQQSHLHLVPVSFHQARKLVNAWHRHLPAPRGCKFSLAVADDTNRIVGVAIVGLPIARGLDDDFTLEVTRLATDGTPNACSALYAACRRATHALGYQRLVTYTRAGEPGTSLRAAGWRPSERLRTRTGWNTPRRPRPNQQGTSRISGIRWEAP